MRFGAIQGGGSFYIAHSALDPSHESFLFVDASAKEMAGATEAVGKISRIANGVAGAVELPESPDLARDVFPENERDDDDLPDLATDAVEVDHGGVE
jgi:hypothetical protein